jgi:hypothetical protein
MRNLKLRNLLITKELAGGIEPPTYELRVLILGLYGVLSKTIKSHKIIDIQGIYAILYFIEPYSFLEHFAYNVLTSCRL